jgi:CRP-like cAMP-binding protein
LTCVNVPRADGASIDAVQHKLQSSLQRATGHTRDRKLLDGVISNLPAFRQLPQKDLDTLATHSQLRESRRGAVIVARGERMPGVIALAYGSAKLALRRANGEEKVVRLLGPGEHFGLEAALLDRPCPVHLVALSNSLVATIPPVPLLRMMEHDASFARCVARELAERMLELISELEASLQQGGLQRLACYLNSLARPNGQPGPWIARLPVTKTTVAARLGVKKETLSRMLRELAVRGLIAVSGPEVAILDRVGLARLVDATS